MRKSENQDAMYLTQSIKYGLKFQTKFAVRWKNIDYRKIVGSRWLAKEIESNALINFHWRAWQRFQTTNTSKIYRNFNRSIYNIPNHTWEFFINISPLLLTFSFVTTKQLWTLSGEVYISNLGRNNVNCNQNEKSCDRAHRINKLLQLCTIASWHLLQSCGISKISFVVFSFVVRSAAPKGQPAGYGQ